MQEHSAFLSLLTSTPALCRHFYCYSYNYGITASYALTSPSAKALPISLVTPILSTLIKSPPLAPL